MLLHCFGMMPDYINLEEYVIMPKRSQFTSATSGSSSGSGAVSSLLFSQPQGAQSRLKKAEARFLDIIKRILVIKV